MAESLASNSLLGLKTRTGRCCRWLAQVLLGEAETDLKDEKLQLSDIVRVHPVLGGLSNKIALTTTSRAVALDWITPRPHDVKQPRQLDNIRIVVVFEERALLQSRGKGWLEDPTSFFLQPSAPRSPQQVADSHHAS